MSAASALYFSGMCQMSWVIVSMYKRMRAAGGSDWDRGQVSLNILLLLLGCPRCYVDRTPLLTSPVGRIVVRQMREKLVMNTSDSFVGRMGCGDGNRFALAVLVVGLQDLRNAADSDAWIRLYVGMDV